MEEFARVCSICGFFHGCMHYYEKVVNLECLNCSQFLELCDVKLAIILRKIEVTHGVCAACLPEAREEIYEFLRKEKMAKK